MKLEFSSIGFWIAFVIFIVAVVMLVGSFNPLMLMIAGLALSRMLP